MNVKIEDSWGKLLKEDFENDNFKNLKAFLIEEKANHEVFPKGSHIFKAFDQTPLDNVKVVIIGQDPYHGDGQAHGLCFSVSKGVRIPPSLRNIYKELNSDIGINIPNHGNLSEWTNQGVLLLNSILTVRAHKASSHQKKGWEIFTDSAIKKISDYKKHCVFILWGNFAQKKALLIDDSKHLIIKSVHPSPLSAYGGFFGSKPFSKTNEYLISKNIEPINWNISFE